VILRKLLQYIRERQRVSLTDVCLHLDTEPDAAKAMLQDLEKRGRIRAIDPAGCSKQCCFCEPDDCSPKIWESV